MFNVRYRSLVVVLFSVSASTFAHDWPNWRGPNHDGVSREQVAQRWSGSPKVLWQQRIGAAFSAVSAVGDRVYTCGTERAQQVLFCLDASSGDVVWKQAFERELKENLGGDGTRATPTVDQGRVYILGAHGKLICFDAKNGRKIWERSFRHSPTWSYSGSVLIEGDLAVVSPGKEHGGLLAVDKSNGKTVWKAGDDGAGYATPYPFTAGGKRYIVGFLATEAIIVEAESGRQVWSLPWKTSYDVNAATPIFHDGHLFLSSGYGVGCSLIELTPSGGGLSGKTVWNSKVLRSKFQTCVLHEGKLYGADEQAFKCVDWKTGELLWRQDRLDGWRTRHGTVILVDDTLLFLSEKGQLEVGKASPDGFRSLASGKVLGGRCWTVPTLQNGRLYVRNFEKIVCLDLSR